MTIVMPRFLIGLAVVYGALWIMGPTAMLWCISVAVGGYALIYLGKFVAWAGPAGCRSIVAGIKAAMRANYRAIALATVYGLFGGLVGGLIASVAMGVIALPFVGPAMQSKDLIVWVVYGWFLTLFGLLYFLEWHRQPIQANIPVWRE